MFLSKSRNIVRTVLPVLFIRTLFVGGSFVIVSGCDETPQVHDAAERDAITGLTESESREILVKVGTRSITLGDYVATLLRMDRFERLRFQSEERQKQLLDEMIEVELLAQEAKRLGLDKDPEVQLQIQQAMRDELLRKLEAQLPPASELTEREVRDYYDAHRTEFKEPERRRILAIQLGDEARAELVLKEANGASGQKWGELAKKYSLNRHNLGDEDAHELAGDLGFVSAPGQKRGQNDKVPEPMRSAIFEVDKVGDVVNHLVKEEKFFYVVRMGGVSAARDRSLTDADRAIRVELRRRKFLEAEKKLEADLRAKYSVVIDEKAISDYQPKMKKPTLPISGDPVPGSVKRSTPQRIPRNTKTIEGSNPKKPAEK